MGVALQALNEPVLAAQNGAAKLDGGYTESGLLKEKTCRQHQDGKHLPSGERMQLASIA